MSNYLPALRTGGVPALPRTALRAINEVRGEVATRAARIEGIAYTVHVGLNAVANLAETEAQLIQRSPLAEPRLRLLGDAGAATIANIIAEQM